MRVARAVPRLVVLFAAFVAMGLPEGTLGAAWPSLRASFDQPEAALARLIVAYTVGYLVSTVLLGAVVKRLGTDATIRLGMVAAALGLAGYAFTPVWSLVIAAAFVLGVGIGTIDASVNADVALHHGQRTMNLLHASWGVGATLGPLIITALLLGGGSWRLGYGALLVVQVGLLGAFLASVRANAGSDEQMHTAQVYAPRAARPTLVVAATLLYFAAYVAAEVSIGHWSFSVLTESRGASETVAGISVAAYWGGLTVGRFLLAVAADRIHPMTLLRVSGGAALVATLWFGFDLPGAVAALPLIGLALAGVFPALVLLTSSWLAPELVTRTVGWQLSASSAGAIVAALALGAVADSQGIGATAPAMIVLVAILAISHLATEAAARS